MRGGCRRPALLPVNSLDLTVDRMLPVCAHNLCFHSKRRPLVIGVWVQVLLLLLLRVVSYDVAGYLSGDVCLHDRAKLPRLGL